MNSPPPPGTPGAPGPSGTPRTRRGAPRARAVQPEITYTNCRRCGTEIAGLDGRYACGVCGWANHYSEGYHPLPTARDDPDWTGPNCR
ncbi:hypothetical protein ACFYVL_10475 [Streptomyces sp. NPDC004111]|uniref:hypothetical protein n=1 Tax=Streptomyces sp. NPDC004111 TaxID=3364690 RepID=UPI00367FAB10